MSVHIGPATEESVDRMEADKRQATNTPKVAIDRSDSRHDRDEPKVPQCNANRYSLPDTTHDFIGDAD